MCVLRKKFNWIGRSPIQLNFRGCHRRYGQANLINFALTFAEEIQATEPRKFREALNNKESEEWIRAMEEEMLSLEKNKTWILVDQPRN